MANQRAIRRRIRSVRSTQQITKAMKMVAAAKLRRCQEAVLQARPYSEAGSRVIASLSSRVDPAMHPLLRVPPEDGRMLLIAITSDKGLCGSFNASILRRATAFLAGRPPEATDLIVIGRKGRDFFRRRPVKVIQSHVGLFQELTLDRIREIAGFVRSAFLEGVEEHGRYDSVQLLYNEFRSMVQQQLVLREILPIPRETEEAVTPAVEYLYEPEAVTLLDRMLPGYVTVQIWRALLESAAAEQAARMTAMGNATENAAEMIDRLTLEMNRARQASITRELIEVVSGAAPQAK